jgi:hypothetical protein
MTRLKDLTGLRFGRLLVIERNGSVKIGKDSVRANWRCRCDCGNTKTIASIYLLGGNSNSCGCLGLENRIKNVTKGRCARWKSSHGMSKTAMYKRWRGMLGRCRYHLRTTRYFLRGITVCDRWQKFENFIEDMGYPPTPKHQIDRINNDGNYEPGNCRWVTVKENAANTCRTVLIDIDGEKYPLREACKKIGMQYPTVSSKAKKTGMSHQEAFDYFRKKKTTC